MYNYVTFDNIQRGIVLYRTEFLYATKVKLVSIQTTCYKFRMLNIITERKQLKIYTQKENIRESVYCKKNQHNKTEDSNEGKKGMKKMKDRKV